MRLREEGWKDGYWVWVGPEDDGEWRDTRRGGYRLVVAGRGLGAGWGMACWDPWADQTWGRAWNGEGSAVVGNGRRRAGDAGAEASASSRGFSQADRRGRREAAAFLAREEEEWRAGRRQAVFSRPVLPNEWPWPLWLAPPYFQEHLRGRLVVLFGIAWHRDKPCFYGRLDGGDGFHWIPGAKTEFQNGLEGVEFA